MIITNVETQDLISQLGREVVVSYEASSATVTVIVTALLALQVQTPAVTLGTISGSYSSLTRSIKVDGDTILRALYRLRDTVGGYIYVDNNRALQWVSSLGEDKGQQIRYRKNLKGIEREIDYKELYNRIYAYGAGEGDARIVLTAPGYVQDTDSQTEWGGIYPGVFIDKSITHPDTLLAWANLLLIDHADPVISYRIDTVDLSQSTELSFSFEALQLGSKVTVIDEDLGINVSVNVVKIEHPDLLHPENMTVDLANSIKDITDTLSEVYDIQQFNNHIATKIGAGQVIVNGAFTVLDWASAGETTINGANIKTGTIIALGTVTTGTIQSTNWGSGAGSQFLLSDGTFKLGGSSSPKLSWNGTTLSITGNITCTGGAISATYITGGTLSFDSIICSGSLSATRISGGTLDCADITVSHLTADMIQTGILSSTMTVSGTIQTAASGNRIKLTSSGMTAYGSAIWFYDTGGTYCGCLAAVSDQFFVYRDDAPVVGYVGDSSNKFIGYFSSLPSCPEGLTTQPQALDIIRKIKPPKVEDTGRWSFKDTDFPAEMKVTSKEVIHVEVDDGKGGKVKRPQQTENTFEEIEYIKTIGVLVQAVRELTEKVDLLEAR